MAKEEGTRTPAPIDVTGLGAWFRPFPFLGANPVAMLREMTRAFDRSLWPGEPKLGTSAPAVECQRVDGELVVTAELPGLKREDVNVRITDDSLIADLKPRRRRRVTSAPSAATASTGARSPCRKGRVRSRSRHR